MFIADRCTSRINCASTTTSSPGARDWPGERPLASRAARRARVAALLATTALVAPFVLFAASPAAAQVGDGTWLTNPGSNDFNTPANFTPAGVPTGNAIFGMSNRTTLIFSQNNTTLNGFKFNAGADAYTFNLTGQSLTFAGTGINNAAGAPAPTFNVDGINSRVNFNNGSSADNAIIKASANGIVSFTLNSTAGTAQLISNAGGLIDFSARMSPLATAGSIEGAGNFQLVGTTLTVGSTDTSTTVSGNISGAGGKLVKTGNGTLTLTGNNTFDGGYTQNKGTTAIGSNMALGNGPVSFQGGTIRAVANNLDVAKNIVIDNGYLFSTATFDTNGNTLTLSGNILDSAAKDAVLVKTGAGTLVLIGTNTYSGHTVFKGGTISVGRDASLGGTTASLSFDGGTLQTTASFNSARNLFLDPGGGTIETLAGRTLTLTGKIQNDDIANPGGLIKTGDGTLALFGANTFDRGFTQNGGTTAIGNNTALGLGQVTFQAGAIRAEADGLVVNNGITLDNGMSPVAAIVDTNGNTLTLNGNINQAAIPGGLIKFGAGTLVLTGNNNFSGGYGQGAGTTQIATSSALGTGPVTFVAGTLQSGNDNLTLNNAFSFNGNTTNSAIDTAGNTLTINGNLSGPGGFTALNSDGVGILRLNNGNADFAGTIDNQTSLQFINNATAGKANISNGKSLAFNNNATAGNATITNNKILSFNQSSTAGNATITTNKGASTSFVDTGSGGNARFITNAGGRVDFSGLGQAGTTAGSIEGAGNYQLGSKTLTVGSNNSSTTVSGVIQDGGDVGGSGGSLIKTGSGTLTLSGANTYTGPTTINGGGLVVDGSIASGVTVNSGGKLAGSGTVANVTVNGGGTLAPGSGANFGTLTVSAPPRPTIVAPLGLAAPQTLAGLAGPAPGGNVVFQPGSIFAVRVLPGTNNSDQLAAAGTVTVNGGSLALTFLPSNPAAGVTPATRYTVLTAAGGVTGQFDSVSILGSPPLLLSPTLTIDPANLVVTFVANNASPAPSGPTFTTLAATPNQFAVGATFDGLPLLSSPLTLPLAFSTNADSVRFALDQLSGEVHASTAGVLLDDTRLVRDAILARLRQVSTVDLLSKGGPTTGAIAGADPALGLTLWTQALGSRADAQGDGNASSLTRSTAGVFGGADLALLDGTLRLGLAGGYTSTSVRTDHLRGSSDVDTGYAAAYLGARLGGFALRGGATIGFNSIDTTRDLTVPGYAGRLSSGTDARTFQGFAEVGYGIDLGKVGTGTIALEPFAGIALARFDRDASTERGSSIAALSIRSDDQSVAFSTIGLRGAATFALGDGLTATPRLSAAYQHASGDVRPSADLAFLAGGAPFTVSGTPLTKDALLFEAGVEFKLANDAVRLNIDYSGRVGDEVEEHAIKGGLNVRF